MQKDSLNLLLSMSQGLESGLNLDALLRRILDTTIEGVRGQEGSIIVLDERGWPSHWFVLQQGQEAFVASEEAKVITQQGMVSWVLEHGRGDLVQDLSRDPRWLPLPDLSFSVETGSALCLPLILYQRTVGVLTILHADPGQFQTQDLKLLQSIAEPIALSIENARLYEMVRHRAEEMAALYEVAINISSGQPVHHLLNTIVVQTMDLLHCQGGGVFLWQEQDSELELIAAYDPEIDMRGMRLQPGEGLVGRVFETGEPLTLEEYESQDLESGELVDGVEDAGMPVTAALGAPLVWQGKPIGVLLATDRRTSQHFGSSDRHLLSLLAHQSAAAIASGQLHERTFRRLEELTFLNETIQDITATLDLYEIFEILTRRVKDLIGVEACSIALVDRDTRELVFHAASGGGSETVKGERIPWGQGIVGAAAQQREPVNVSNVSQDDRFFKEVDEKQTSFVTQSILAVPMISRGQVVGVVEALNKPEGFDTEDERLLSALASLAASVVDNAYLFGSVRAAEIRYQTLFEDAADAAWVTDTAGKVIQSNRKANALTGQTGEDVQGVELWALALSEERETWRAAHARALTGEEPTLESWIIGADRIPIPLELRLKRIGSSLSFGFQSQTQNETAERDAIAKGSAAFEPDQLNVVRVQWIGRDISARYELEQLRNNLTHMIVHDLRNPVGTISNSLELLRPIVAVEEVEQAEQLIEIASRATQRLSNLVDSLLDIDRLEAGQELTNRLPVSIAKLVNSATAQLVLYVRRKRMELERDLPEDLPLVLADSAMIERVLVNLLENALKFTPTEGKVEVAAELVDDMMQVSVVDNGPGVPFQYQRRIFEKFTRMRSESGVEGIGLGLAFCRLAVEAHGGRIWVESTPGEGATFIFTLPLAEAV
jgi:PAS domain S-box-containing protein